MEIPLENFLLGHLGGSVGWAADLGSGHDLTLCEFEPRVGLCADRSEPGACFNVYLFLGQRETEHERGRVRERETQNVKQAPGSELSAQSPTRGLNSWTARS